MIRPDQHPMWDQAAAQGRCCAAILLSMGPSIRTIVLCAIGAALVLLALYSITSVMLETPTADKEPLGRQISDPKILEGFHTTIVSMGYVCPELIAAYRRQDDQHGVHFKAWCSG